MRTDKSHRSSRAVKPFCSPASKTKDEQLFMEESMDECMLDEIEVDRDEIEVD